MESKLNHLLANVTVEYHKLQNLHWYISGSDFFQVHAKLEELYDGLLPIVDDVAETILQQGGKPGRGSLNGKHQGARRRTRAQRSGLRDCPC